MTGFNLSDWAIRHRALVGYFIVAVALMGVYGYQHLGQADDPPFTFKVMVVRTLWPGATAQDVEQQVTDRIEKKLQEAPHVDHLVSYSRPSESVILFMAKDSAPRSVIPEVFYQVRKKVGDIRQSLPAGVVGPFFNDEFGDVYGNIYAVVSDELSDAALKQYADGVRDALLRVKQVAKVDLFGEQDEKIYLDIANAKLATLGLDLNTVIQALSRQNAIAGAGFFETATDRIYLRPSGGFDTVAAVRNTVIRAGGRQLRIGDLAEVRRGSVDPPAPRVRTGGQRAIAIGVVMTPGGDIIQLGRELRAEMQRLQNQLPLGVDLQEVASQPEVVKRSIDNFVKALAEAVLIVLGVTLFSLGVRTGLVVALSIPLVLAATFLLMWFFNIGLHKISLGSLILALGLLVDDAIIAVEMMWVKMEEGWERARAAAFAYTSTAGPMLSGTLVTMAGFLPIATARSATGEYTVSIFQVNAIALLLSWLAAVVVIPWLGYGTLPDPRAPHKARLLTRWWRRAHHQPVETVVAGVHSEYEVYHTAFYRRFRVVVQWCVAQRWFVITVTVALFVLAIVGFGSVQKQFFPVSTRLELMIDLRLPEGSSLKAVDTEVHKLEAILAKEPGITNFVAYIGWGAPRYYLGLDQQLPATRYAQFVILTEDVPAREALRARLIQLFEDDFPTLRANVTRVENGPPVGFPVQFRVSGQDLAPLRGVANAIADVMRGNPHLSNVHLDWEEQSKVIGVEIDQDKARLLGVSSQEVAQMLNTLLTGMPVTSYRERDKAIEVVLRGDVAARTQLALLDDLTVPTASGKSVPLAHIGRIQYRFEPGVIWRRDRLPTITVRANVYGTIQPATVTAQIEPLLAPIRAQLPAGFRLETGGTVEEAAKGQGSVNAGIPLFVLVVLTVLMIQLQSFSRVVLVVLTAPLGLIGVTLFLLLFNQPFGFVAMLGTIALFGMIMRNSVILVDQIQQDIAAGRSQWEAIVESTVRRFRPIVLTAAAAVLAMVPLSRNAFFGPMAVAIMGGLIVATLLTLLFLPALYAAWYRVRRVETVPADSSH
ncbi:putative efflux transporter causing drug resistance (Acr family) [Candidatus Competibacter denitrificans Run_A_D11]|uniref:Efflux transporter causing drug resistance (Acr family) n=1 Tax=Candidatus Competibacter denitrificans Run_A_D11 TaxID=1400863 RepID=W6M5B8_9GAMM|nr:efflux RND transporter permease subunit [Candidatus Competibacter denitrificans]CDI00990.1 putative efflux transporter causing drug resistance (Acr family) [Candidatus Competibacter denitrificans Run_A_D11]